MGAEIISIAGGNASLDSGIQKFLRTWTATSNWRHTRPWKGWDTYEPVAEKRREQQRIGATFYEFMGSLVLTYVSAAAVLSSGTLSVKYDMVELTSGRALAIAVATASIYAALLHPVVGLRVQAKDARNRKDANSAVLVDFPFARGHFNPATTLACYLLNQVDARTATFYFIAQLVGSVLGSLMLWLTWFSIAPTTSLGSTIVNSDAGPWMATSMEFAMSFVFHVVLLGSFATKLGNSRKINSVTELMTHSRDGFRAISVSFMLLVSLVIAITVSGGSLNPARSIGPALCSGVWQDQWVYWIGPFLGSTAAAFLVKTLF